MTDEKTVTRDSNGTTLSSGDAAILIEDLKVKGNLDHAQARHRRKEHPAYRTGPDRVNVDKVKGPVLSTGFGRKD